MKIQIKPIILIMAFLLLRGLNPAQTQAQQAATEQPQQSEAVRVIPTPVVAASAPIAGMPAAASAFDPLKYTLGPDDAVEIQVMRHPEFSGVYPINQEGKLQYRFVGDIDVIGLTKQQLEQRIREALSTYVNSPEVSVTVTEYRSKYFYVLGEVGAPGKYYMRAETISVREAVFEAGLPTLSAAMRKCQLITPSMKGKPRNRGVNLYSILYKGNLRRNINMHPGDVLYVPSTVMAKVIRVINPVTSSVGLAAGTPESAASGRTAVETLQGRPGVR